LQSGGEVYFNRASFSGSKVSFNRASISGGEVSFDDASFGGGEDSFDRTRFSGCTVDFSAAGDWSLPPAFPWTDKPPSGVRLPDEETQSQL
jgi:hypothetical protein